jgi:hypothetical protein
MKIVGIVAPRRLSYCKRQIFHTIVLYRTVQYGMVRLKIMVDRTTDSTKTFGLRTLIG